jgi:hypothetical protein
MNNIVGISPFDSAQPPSGSTSRPLVVDAHHKQAPRPTIETVTTEGVE